MIEKILFVCSGNTCRSPISEYIFNYYSKILEEPYVASSAGIYVTDGTHINKEAQKQLEKRGINSDNFRSKSISLKLINKYNFVICMTDTHRRILVELYPWESEKFISLGDCTMGKDVLDPYGGSPDVYEKCATDIEDMIIKLFVYLDRD